ncbi:MAG TPA: hypothetical protein PKY29_04490 [Ferruginibacter sp.]|mgnify:CR=1 FL=1|nr:hypothetical protein [Ferruginibacter sp.]HRQ20547.1 hypothetical protein [Ferruginibacter sp.]
MGEEQNNTCANCQNLFDEKDNRVQELEEERSILLQRVQELEEDNATVNIELARYKAQPLKFAAARMSDGKEMPVIEHNEVQYKFTVPKVLLNGSTYTALQASVSPEIIESILSIDGQKILKPLKP